MSMSNAGVQDYSTLVGEVKPTYGVRTKKIKAGESRRTDAHPSGRQSTDDIGTKRSSIQFQDLDEDDLGKPQMSRMSLGQMKEAEDWGKS